MRVNIFDVEHGECIIIEMPNGKTVMIGAGHNATTGWRPSTWFANRGVGPTVAVLPNLDSDHFTDLSNFPLWLKPLAVIKNRSINTSFTRLHKTLTGGLASGVSVALDWHDSYSGPSFEIDYGDATLLTFAHSVGTFPPEDYNNLSVVTFIMYGGIGIMLPSDLEEMGWQMHLLNPMFRAVLGSTNILLASHHGRANGYCREIFDFCSPDICIISDKKVVHETQRHDLYQPHITGLRHIQTGELRRVLSTRKDGNLVVDIEPTGNYMIWMGA